MFKLKHQGEILNNYLKAGDQSCSPDLLEALAHSEIDRIRLRVAENPRTPKDALEILAVDKNPDVRVAAAINPATPPHISFKLAFDENPNVRLGLADDISTPIEILDQLQDDSNPYVSHTARQTKAIVLSHGKPRSFGRRFIRWVSELNQPEQKFA